MNVRYGHGKPFEGLDKEIRKSLEITANQENIFVKACEKGDFDTLSKFLDSNKPWRWHTHDHYCRPEIDLAIKGMLTAIDNNQVPVISKLIDAYDFTKVSNSYKHALTDRADKLGHKDMSDLLIEKNIYAFTIVKKDSYNFMNACARGDMKVIDNHLNRKRIYDPSTTKRPLELNVYDKPDKEGLFNGLVKAIDNNQALALHQILVKENNVLRKDLRTADKYILLNHARNLNNKEIQSILKDNFRCLRSNPFTSCFQKTDTKNREPQFSK